VSCEYSVSLRILGLDWSYVHQFVIEEDAVARRRPGAWRLLAAAGAVLVLALAACGGGSRAAGSSAGTSGGVTGDVTVFAAASLTEAFTEIGNKLEKQNPDLNVRFNFAGSSTLAEQINRGAPADVFASAN